MSRSSAEYWGGSDMIFQCLIDRKRALMFKKVIDKFVTKTSIVVDAGTGTGILAMFAAAAGAKKVYAIEADKNLYKTLEMNLSLNKYKDKIQLIKGDASNVKLPEKVDIITCEMIATGLIDEYQIPVMNNLLKYCKKTTKILPYKFLNFVELVNINCDFYGAQMEVIQYEYAWNKKIRSKGMSSKAMYKEIDFSKLNDLRLSAEVIVKIKRKGTINGLKISNKTIFPDMSELTDTAAYCMPIVVPIKEQIVQKREIFLIKLDYKLCHGFGDFKFEVKKLG